jgi:hypothetical protein
MLGCAPHEVGPAAGAAPMQAASTLAVSPAAARLRVVVVLRGRQDATSGTFLRSLEAASHAAKVEYVSPAYGSKHVFHFTLSQGQDSAALLAALNSMPALESAELDERAKAH